MNAVSLYINAGEWLGLVGESGSGKTTLLLAIMGLLPANARQCGGNTGVRILCDQPA